MSRGRYLTKRFIYTVLLLWVVLTVLFFFFRLMPGDYSSLMLRQGASQETVEAFRQRWGLNQPLYIQYWNYLVNFLSGDLGTSRRFNEPVLKYVAPKIANTLILVAPAITTGYIIGSILGALMGHERGSNFEKYGISSLIMIGSFPGFFIAIMAIIVVSSWLNLTPTNGMLSVEATTRFANAPWWRPYLTTDFLHHYVLPFSVVVLRFTFAPALVMRTSVTEVMGQDFMWYQKVSGLPYMERIMNLGRHSILPVITLYPVSMTQAVSGLVLIELVFNWPGIGYALVQAVFSRDTPVVQFIFFITAAMVIVSNFAVDVLYGIIDPRVSVGDQN